LGEDKGVEKTAVAEKRVETSIVVVNIAIGV
jgi:hypothetical protein